MQALKFCFFIGRALTYTQIHLHNNTRTQVEKKGREERFPKRSRYLVLMTSVTTQQTNREMRTNVDNQPAAFMKIIRHRFTLSSAPPGVCGARWSHRHEVGESGGSLDVMESHLADAVWWR